MRQDKTCGLTEKGNKRLLRDCVICQRKTRGADIPLRVMAMFILGYGTRCLWELLGLFHVLSQSQIPRKVNEQLILVT